jgi:hypothetical protein
MRQSTSKGPSTQSSSRPADQPTTRTRTRTRPLLDLIYSATHRSASQLPSFPVSQPALSSSLIQPYLDRSVSIALSPCARRKISCCFAFFHTKSSYTNLPGSSFLTTSPSQSIPPPPLRSSAHPPLILCPPPLTHRRWQPQLTAVGCSWPQLASAPVPRPTPHKTHPSRRRQNPITAEIISSQLLFHALLSPKQGPHRYSQGNSPARAETPSARQPSELDQTAS